MAAAYTFDGFGKVWHGEWLEMVSWRWLEQILPTERHPTTSDYSSFFPVGGNQGGGTVHLMSNLVTNVPEAQTEICIIFRFNIYVHHYLL